MLLHGVLTFLFSKSFEIIYIAGYLVSTEIKQNVKEFVLKGGGITMTFFRLKKI